MSGMRTVTGAEPSRGRGASTGAVEVSRAVLLPHAPASVTSARQRLSCDLNASGLGCDRADDAALVLSELLSNALRHAAPLPAPAPPDCVGVSWEIQVGRDPDTGLPGGWIEVSVRDGGADTLPRIARPSLSALGGRGLGIVQHLAGKWGTEVEPMTTTVWAVLEIGEQDLGSEDGPAEDRFSAPRSRTGPFEDFGAEPDRPHEGRARGASALL